MRIRALGLCALAALLGACAATSVKKSWKAPDYQGGPVTKAAVLAVAKEGLLRQGFENRFVARFKEKGVTAVTTFDLLSLPEINDDKMAAAARFRAAGAEVVVLLRLMDVAASYREVRPGAERYAAVTTGIESTPWYDYYSVAYMDLSPTYGQLKQYVYLEASIFDLKTAKRLWSGYTRTVLTEQMDRVAEMNPIVAKIIAAMGKDRMVP